MVSEAMAEAEAEAETAAAARAVRLWDRPIGYMRIAKMSLFCRIDVERAPRGVRSELFASLAFSLASTYLILADSYLILASYPRFQVSILAF